MPAEPSTATLSDVIVDVATYSGGQRSSAEDLSDDAWSRALAGRRAAGEGFVWIGLKDPGSDELSHLADQLGLHPLAVEDALSGHQRPKVERYEGSLFVVLKTLSYEEDTSDVETGEIMLFLGDRFVVTVRRGEANPLGPVRTRLERGSPLELGPAAVLHAVLDAVVDTYVAIDAELQKDLDAIEEAVFAGDRAADATTIYALKREVLEARRAAAPLLEPVQQLAEGREDWVPEPVRPFFRDVADHLVRTVEHVEGYDRLLTDVLSAHLAQVSVRQNEDMRRISAWVAIAAVPTLLAGIWGMNFAAMPELGWRWGYPVALTVMATLCVALHRAFSRSGWL